MNYKKDKFIEKKKGYRFKIKYKDNTSQDELEAMFVKLG